jgi:hypothetical protein
VRTLYLHKKLPAAILKWLYYFVFPPAVYEGFNCFASFSALDTVRVVVLFPILLLLPLLFLLLFLFLPHLLFFLLLLLCWG